jgi:hypothetical protein
MHFSVTLRIFNRGPGGAYLEFSSILENASLNLRILRDAKVHCSLAGRKRGIHGQIIMIKLDSGNKSSRLECNGI